MCGACGRVVVADEVLGAERTLRSQFIVAQTVSNLCGAVRGLPKIQVAGDGWLLRTATGSVHPVDTVRDVWTRVFREADRTGSAPAIVDALRADLPEADGLPRTVLQAGLEAASGPSVPRV